MLTAISASMGLQIRTVGDMGAKPDSLPMFILPEVPRPLSTLLIVLHYAVALAIVGLLESMMIATIVDT